MKTRNVRHAALAALASLGLLAGGDAHAIFRTYLSVNGNDANPCTVAAPCRLLPAALAAVDAGGEIWMLDSANFNTSVVNITKSVTILAVPGQLGSVVGIGGTAFSINGAGIEVTLQNLNILSFQGSGDIGVLVGNAGRVIISNCNIFGFRGPLGNNGLGIWITPGANSPRVTVTGTTLRNNHHGIALNGNGHLTVHRSQIVSNGGIGVWVNAGDGFTAVAHVSETLSSNNNQGFYVAGAASGFNSQLFVARSAATENINAGFMTDGGATALLAVSDSLASGNAWGFYNNAGSGTFQSRGNNTVVGNVQNTLNTITFMPGT